ncbi:hypothetical protein Kfla_1585 [Kribbella flavida DSM 17836]|uniref:DUF3105 domain-containing protein n=1 Tax=Kribbella flavida (strain DSM 17836 / JCM 10339 / NBRC 14399) TaxID=479435 RepID=D2PMD7_KRIFD|nr:DUF3105 domain-containing protein [Kribbella flavida]ADB30681.1 hypothetical protein Kfla_1585 [Kribbella flavida DSM 17836]
MGKASSQKQSRRELIEKMQRDQARSDKRRTWIIVAASILVGLAIIAYPAIRVIQDSRTADQAITAFGASPSEASCDKVIDDKATGTQDHKPDGEMIAYPVSPPSSGPHYQTWAPFGKKFYTADDRPPVPNLVHNLEHGYTILWYRDSLPQEQVDEIEKISKAKLPESTLGKFIAAPFSDSDGPAWPAGKQVAFSHWSGNTAGQQTALGHRQFCNAVSGQALKEFMEKYPAMDAQEPNGG